MTSVQLTLTNGRIMRPIGPLSLSLSLSTTTTLSIFHINKKGIRILKTKILSNKEKGGETLDDN